ncbi:MAG: PDZ domain-containing protein [Verrucomicrobia bacterium]|jgi:S1-C subfamily serine protease|nr:PDZ domain-containing protein [Verrucomicrobiota bacterium]OQC65640.1 MAG: putative periplasmic serine endoprotease DegP-like precursor [Verrucomicrobia bacterium ADurb.Bin006]MDI9382650.1 PDZ domain-containing protein [Verrucomicrobiota bacterium]NMD21704.1 PDZ domain-containing protein [Verrucomicrobiota bacterium]HOA62190.1 PDZ domain-containing protein [Verrucomicrobiota bacterium]
MKTKAISCVLLAAVGAALTLTPPTRALPAAEKEKEKATYLGIAAGEVDDTLREQLKLGRGAGIRVEAVVPGSPADKAGVKAHDILEKLDAQVLFNAQQLVALVRSFAPGDKVTLALVRQGDRQTLDVTLGETEIAPAGKSLSDVWDGARDATGIGRLFGLPLDKAIIPNLTIQPPDKPSAYLGVELGYVISPLATQLGLEDESGALVNMVVDESPAARAGLKRHDIIVKLDGKKVRDPADLSARIDKHKKGDKITLTVIRGGKPIEITATLSEKAATDPARLQKLLREYYPIVPGIRMLRTGPDRNEIVVRLDSENDGNAYHVERRIVVDPANARATAESAIVKPGHSTTSQVSVEQKVIVMKTDGGMSTVLEEKDGHRHVTVKDAEGKVVFDGPVNSDGDRQRLPTEAREQLDRIEQSLKAGLDSVGKDVIHELRLAPGPTVPDVI